MVLFDSLQYYQTLIYPALSVTNGGSGQKTIAKSNLFASVSVVYSGNSWSSEKSSLGLTGSTVVAASGTETVFAANSVTKVVNDPTIIQFLQEQGVTIDDCDIVYSTIYYRDPDTGDYWPLTSFDKPTS